LASANLDVASNDVDDARRDLADAGGNLHGSHRRDETGAMKQPTKQRAAGQQKFSGTCSGRCWVLVHRVRAVAGSEQKAGSVGKVRERMQQALISTLTSQRNALAAPDRNREKDSRRI